MTGTNLKVKFIKVVDGDTIKVEHQGETTNLRILADPKLRPLIG